MKVTKVIIVSIFFAVTCINLSGQPNMLLGHWEGGISRLGSIQVLRFDVYGKGDSIWATYDDPAVAIYNAPFFNFKKVNDTLLMNFGYGNFKAVLHTDVNEITGVNTGWNPRLDLHMRKYGQKLTASFLQEEMQIKNGNITIAASLFKPKAKKKYPIVVLVHGSGMVERSTGYYYSLAYNLAEKGIGVLLYDKRGCGKTTGNYERASFKDLADDVVAGVQYLKARKDLTISKIGLLGTSQGGWVSYIAAKKTKEIQFIVANVGAGVSLFQQDIDRVKYSLQDEGFENSTIDSAVNYTSNYFNYVTGKLSWQQFLPMLKLASNSTYADFVFLPQKDKDEDYLWWSKNDYDPAVDLSSIHCPLLSLFGEKDVFVPPASNEKLMRNYLTKAGVYFQIKVFPNCGHSTETFSTLKGGDWKFPEKFWIWKQKTPGFYETIIQWINTIPIDNSK